MIAPAKIGVTCNCFTKYKLAQVVTPQVVPVAKNPITANNSILRFVPTKRKLCAKDIDCCSVPSISAVRFFLKACTSFTVNKAKKNTISGNKAVIKNAICHP